MNAFAKIQAVEIPTLVSDFVISSYGGGTNSTALLIECVKRGIRIDMILFADTGGEKPHPELLQKALEMEAQAELTDIAGLGRNFSWKSIHQQQDAFMDHFTPDMPCDCYDGATA